MSSSKKADAVTVGVRIRPRNEKELSDGMPVCFSAREESGTVEELDESGVAKNWDYDYVFGPDCTNQYIFQSVGVKLIDAALDGYNTVLFMYGQTSSGKTFTLFGGGGTVGLVDHAMGYVYERIMNSPDTEYVIKLTYAELYNEELKDLLSPVPNENLKIIDDPHLGPSIQNITEATFASCGQIQKLLEEGENRRHFGVTNMNAHSSRSHVLVRLSIEMRKVSYKPTQPLRSSWGRDKPTCLSTLNLVDLAGSERAAKAGTSGQSFKEGSYINKSLLTLGTVISNLSEGKASQHVPYRNSKLTRLLASALGGNCKTCMITCISPASGNLSESLSTLRFASRAKRIVNVVHKNELQDAKSLAARLAQQNSELEFLRSQLEISRQLGFNPSVGEDQAESLRNVALLARKNLRVLRFLLGSVPKLVMVFKNKGHGHLAKKIQEDLVAVIVGTRDVDDVLSELMSMMVKYVPREAEIIGSLRDLDARNESDAVGNFDLIDDEMSPEDAAGILSGLDFGHDDKQEELERSRMFQEGFRGKMVNAVNLLAEEVCRRNEREVVLVREMKDLKSAHAEAVDGLRRSQSAEASLQLRLEEMTSKRESEKLLATQQLATAKEAIRDLESRLSEKESQHVQSIQTINSKDAEIDRLKSQVDVLNRDLIAAAASRKAFEEESFRVRQEMRSQMDKLRLNMHTFLQKGGEDNKIMEMQNETLVREVDSLKDQMELMGEAKERLDEEIVQLRTEVSCLREADRLRLEELTASRDQLARTLQKVHSLRLEQSKAAAVNTVLDEDNQALRATIIREVEEKDAQVADLQDQLNALTSISRNQICSLEADIAVREKTIASLEEAVEIKQALYGKLEFSTAADISRLEKKIVHMTKLTDDLIHENAANAGRSHEVITKLTEENRVLRGKVEDLQNTLKKMEAFIDSQLDDPRPSEYTYYQDGSDEVLVVPSPRLSLLTPVSRSPSLRVPRFSIRPTLTNLFESATPASTNGQKFDYNEAVLLDDLSNGSTSASNADMIRPRSVSSPSGVSFVVPATSDGIADANSRGSTTEKRSKPKLFPIDDGLAKMMASTTEQSEEEMERFERIQYAMKLLQLQLDHVLREGEPLLGAVVDLVQKLSRHSNQLETKLIAVVEKDEGLQLARTSLSTEVTALTDQVVALTATVSGLRIKCEKLELENEDLMNAEKSARELMRQYEAQQEFFKLQIQATKMELDSTRRESETLSTANANLLVRIQSIFEEKVLAEAQVGQVDQELQIVIAERDELIRQFLSKPVGPREFVAQPRYQLR